MEFLNNFDTTRVRIKTAELWLVISHGMKTTIIERNVPMETATLGQGSIIIVLFPIIL